MHNEAFEAYVCTTGVEAESIDRRGYGKCVSVNGKQIRMPITSFRPYLPSEDQRVLNILSVFLCALNTEGQKEKSTWTMKCRFMRSPQHEI